MSDFHLDSREFESFTNRLTDQKKQMPKVTKKLLRRVGSRARTLTVRKAKKLVQKRTGDYYRSIKRGKLWRGNQDEYKIRVYSYSKRAHLLEYGHRMVDRTGKEYGFREGAHVFSKAQGEIKQQMSEIIGKEFEKILKKL